MCVSGIHSFIFVCLFQLHFDGTLANHREKMLLFFFSCVEHSKALCNCCSCCGGINHIEMMDTSKPLDETYDILIHNKRVMMNTNVPGEIQYITSHKIIPILCKTN